VTQGTVSKSAQDKVREFHEKMGFHVGVLGEDVPVEFRLLRARLISEESAELITAIHENNIEKIADGIADLRYVTEGTAVTYGIPSDAVFDEVHYSNMTKDAPNEHSKGGKGDGYQPPHIAGVLYAAKHGYRIGSHHHCGGLLVDNGEYMECSLCG
jgi:predicted HAD superfamily Cof-like phosphohydrolase